MDLGPQHSLVVSAANVDCIGRAFADMPWQNRADSLSVAVPGLPRYSRKEMRVHRFLWTKWRQRRAATAELTFFGIDAGNVYTVNLKRDSGGRLVIEEYMRHYQAVGPGSTADTLVASGVALQRFRLRGGAFAVRGQQRRAGLLAESEPVAAQALTNFCYRGILERAPINQSDVVRHAEVGEVLLQIVDDIPA